MLYIATISHEYGTNIYVAKSEQGLDKQIYDFCMQYWPEGEPVPENNDQAIEDYFSVHETGEFLEILNVKDEDIKD